MKKEQKRVRGKNYPRQMKERAYTLVTKDGHSYRDVAEILGIPDSSIVYRFCQQISREAAITPVKEAVIETDIPVPDRKPTRYYLRLAFRMNEGDSIFFTTPAEGRRMYRAIRDMGFFGRTKQEGSGMRVWKLRDLDARK